MKACRTCLMALVLILMGTARAGLAQDDARPVENANYTEAPADVIAVLEEAGDYTMLIDALKKTGLTKQLEGVSAFTLFAPTDAAFEQHADLADMPAEKMANVLRHHLVMQKIPTEKATMMKKIKVADGGELAITSEGGKLSIGEAQIVQPNLNSANGVIHGIDAILMPAGDAPKKNSEE
ncbi:MAG: fasciclin domain-containing protein [Rhodothermales bacterium]